MKGSHFKHVQRGISLIEILASLGLIAMVIFGATALFSAGSSTQKSNQLAQGLVGIRTAVKGLYAGQGSYATLGTNGNAIVINAGKMPSDFAVSGTSVTHPLNGNLTVANNGGLQFSVTVTNVPQSNCVDLMTSATGWISVRAGSAAARTTPVDPATANADCNAATQTLVFVAS